ncbi:MAG: hypothetical protein IIW54_04760 [Lachnospiraceae bacterium]|nr:hypothetical protein [Lachnospiraceae bacterium]
MKKILLVIAFYLIGLFSVGAQTIEDFNRTAISNKSLTYNDQWQPTATFTLKNLSNKIITNVEIEIFYYGYADGDIFQPTTKCTTSTRITSGLSGKVSFTFSCGDKKPKGFMITRIRYADGSICQFAPQMQNSSLSSL